MGLGLYNASQVLLSDTGAMTNPLTTHHDGKDGSASVVLVSVRNDDVGYYYQTVVVTPLDTVGDDDTIGEDGNGFSVKLKYGTVEPLPHEWNLVTAGDPVTLPSDIGTSSTADTTTYYPVWVRLNVPGNSAVQTKTDLQLRLSSIKRTVTP